MNIWKQPTRRPESGPRQHGYIMLGALIGMFILSTLVFQLNSILSSAAKHKRMSAAIENSAKLSDVRNTVISLAKDIDYDDHFEPLAPYVSSNASETTLPLDVVSDVDTTDLFGTPLLYCAFDLGRQNFVDMTYISDDMPDPPNNISAMIISAGVDRIYQTDCEDYTPMGDDQIAYISDENLRYSAGTFGGWVDQGDLVQLINPRDDVGVGVEPEDKLDINGDIRTRTGLIMDADGETRISMSAGDDLRFYDHEGVLTQELTLQGSSVFGAEFVQGQFGVFRSPPEFDLDVNGALGMARSIYDSAGTRRVFMGDELLLFDQDGEQRISISPDDISLSNLDMNGHRVVNVREDLDNDEYDAATLGYVKSIIAGAQPRLVGFADPHDGDFGGLRGVMNACRESFPQEGQIHACTFSDILSLGEGFFNDMVISGVQSAHVVDGAYLTAFGDGDPVAIAKTGQVVIRPLLLEDPDANATEFFISDNLCRGWTHDSDTVQTAPVIDRDGNITFVGCGRERRLPCCAFTQGGSGG